MICTCFRQEGSIRKLRQSLWNISNKIIELLMNTKQMKPVILLKLSRLKKRTTTIIIILEFFRFQTLHLVMKQKLLVKVVLKDLLQKSNRVRISSSNNRSRNSRINCNPYSSLISRTVSLKVRKKKPTNVLPKAMR